MLPAVLIFTMIASSFQMFAIGVLAAPILEDLAVSRWALGVVGAVNTLVGAASSPFSGRITDKIGPRRSILLLCGIAATGMGLMAIASSLWILGLAAAVSGVPQGWGNPATNSLIAGHVKPERRGTITGVKQSGVTLALFLAGATLPSLAQWTSWNLAAGVFAAIFVLFGVLNAVWIPRSDASPVSPASSDGSVFQPSGSASTTSNTSTSDTSTSDALSVESGGRSAVPTFIWQLAVYAFAMGTSSGSIGRFLPLFAEEAVGMGRTAAGMLIAVVGVCGIVFRIGAARLAGSTVAPQRILTVLSLTATGTSILLISATTVGPWILWPIAVLYALGHIAWNAVVNLTIISSAPRRDAGRFSGIVMLGFLFGMTIGAPLTGWVVDTFDSYQPVWFGAAALAAVAVAIVSRIPSDLGTPRN